MTRARLAETFTDATGVAQTAAQVRVYKRGTGAVVGASTTGTPVVQSVYAVESGGSPLTFPQSPNGLGRLELWADLAEDVDLGVVNGGVASIQRSAFVPLETDATRLVSARTHGAIADDTTEMRAILQAWLNAIPAKGTGLLPSGTYKVTSVLSTCTTVNTSAILSAVTTPGLWTAGDPIAGSGIPDGATVVSVDVTNSRLTISVPATADGTGVAIHNALTVGGRDRVHVRCEPGARIRQATAGVPGLMLVNSSNSMIEGVEVQGAGTAPASAGVYEIGIWIVGTASAGNTVERARVEGFGKRGISSQGPRTDILDCKVIGVHPAAGVDTYLGIVTDGAAGGRSHVSGCYVEGYSYGINCQDSVGRHRVIGNHVYNTAGSNMGLYISAEYSDVTDNVLDSTAGIKMGFGGHSPVIGHNVIKGGSIFLGHTFGAIVDGNAIDGGLINLQVDNNDPAQYPYAPRITNNSVRNSAYAVDGSSVFGAINVRGRGVLIQGNTLENCGGHAISAFDSSEWPIPDLQILNNTIRNAGLQQDDFFAAIRLGYGSGQVFDRCRIEHNTITSRAPTTVTGDTHTGPSPAANIIDGLTAAEAQVWEVGDRITGAGIPANTTIVSINGQSNTLTMSANATSSNTGTVLTRATYRMKYGIQLPAGVTGSVTEFGNLIVGAATAKTAIEAAAVASAQTQHGLELGNVNVAAAAGDVSAGGKLRLGGVSAGTWRQARASLGGSGGESSFATLGLGARGVLFAIDATNGFSAIFMTDGTNNISSEISDPNSKFVNTNSPSNTIGIYSAGSGAYFVKNGYAGAVVVILFQVTDA